MREKYDVEEEGILELSNTHAALFSIGRPQCFASFLFFPCRRIHFLVAYVPRVHARVRPTGGHDAKGLLLGNSAVVVVVAVVAVVAVSIVNVQIVAVVALVVPPESTPQGVFQYGLDRSGDAFVAVIAVVSSSSAPTSTCGRRRRRRRRLVLKSREPASVVRDPRPVPSRRCGC